MLSVHIHHPSRDCLACSTIALCTDGVVCSFYFITWVIKGELFVIDDTNSIYYMPCGDLCGDNTYSYVNGNYSYLGCYDDAVDRVLSGDYLKTYAGMTTEVRRVCASKRGVYF